MQFAQFCSFDEFRDSARASMAELQRRLLHRSRLTKRRATSCLQDRSAKTCGAFVYKLQPRLIVSAMNVYAKINRTWKRDPRIGISESIRYEFPSAATTLTAS